MVAINSFTTIGNSYNNHQINSVKTPFMQKDIFVPSFKAKEIEVEDDYEMETPISDFLLRLKVLFKAPQIVKDAEEIKQQAKLDYSYAKSVLNIRLKKIEHSMSYTPDSCKEGTGDKVYTEYDKNQAKCITTYTTNGKRINIKRIDIINRDRTKDVILVDENNEIYGIRRGVKQIAPQSYLQEAELTFKNGVLTSFFDSISCINDGIAKAKIKTKGNLYKYKNGLVLLYSPKVDYIGNDTYSSQMYCFQNGKIKKYIEGYSVENGVKTHKREIEF